MKHGSQHSFGHVEIGNGTLANGPDGHHMICRSANEIIGVMTERQHFTGSSVDSDHRWLVDHQASPLDDDPRRRCSEIDGQVARHKAQL
jgi:hypothetical protein